MDKHSICSFGLIGISLVLLMGAKEQCQIIDVNIKNKNLKDFTGIKAGNYYAETTTKNMPFTSGKALFVYTQNGEISISSWDKKEIKIEATKKLRSHSEKESKEILKEIKVNISDGTDKLTIETEIPESREEDIGVSYEICLPKEAKLTLETSNGKIKVKDIRGDINVQTTNGGIELGNIQTKSLYCETSNGGISCNINTFLSSSNISLETTNGGIDLEVLETPGLSICAETTNGKIDSDFPIYTDENKLKGNIVIKLTTSNGGISISKKN